MHIKDSPDGSGGCCDLYCGACLVLDGLLSAAPLSDVLAWRHGGPAIRQIQGRQAFMLAELALLVASVGVIELSLVWHPGGVLEALKSTAMNAACLVVVVVAIADGFTRRALSAAPMVFLGKVSYSLYLTHAMVIGALVALLPRLGIVDPLTIAAVSLPASMLVSVVFWRIIEVPSMNLSRSLASSGPRDAVR